MKISSQKTMLCLIFFLSIILKIGFWLFVAGEIQMREPKKMRRGRTSDRVSCTHTQDCKSEWVVRSGYGGTRLYATMLSGKKRHRYLVHRFHVFKKSAP